MKLYLLPALFITSTAFSNDFSEYESNMKNIDLLKNQVNRLELKKKIVDLEVEIYKKRESIAQKKPALDTSIIKEKIDIQPVVNDFDPRDIKLIYVLGSGRTLQAQVKYNDESFNVKNNSVIKGWRVKIDNSSVTLNRNKRVVTL
ncbi:hypothetical protein UA38_13755 [Photobacterium kishitanii]|uniref:Type IV pilus biogenesis protein PilP n=1 Tax=Photobacterium kishitanii TaxID=318456 RepID=A0AAX0YVD1_9GAMM|nr:hypothetical protein [Photobacterium kishitanii]KJG56569.1 hypothetical protein UA38_13755 [Photobacterium kishitanii]KJG61105.1 hypothetical protein UA42_12080 [Photobacterium kishitanii]KJG68808.1 hypothetical protein UA41_14670 [Photobacterium kishitanii]PSX21005.1 hypothetical protein C0W70_01875 [Photobacterium kishitanii]PSX29808.1 hypothetical protein C0W52_00205 [Photobacterium kishitanii]